MGRSGHADDGPTGDNRVGDDPRVPTMYTESG